jgi:hypothetical protein
MPRQSFEGIQAFRDGINDIEGDQQPTRRGPVAMCLQVA